MKLTQLEKAQKLYDRVKELDGEIIEIEKLAQLIADKKTEIKLTLKINDLEEKDKEKSKVAFDEDGSLIHGAYARSLMASMFTIRLQGCDPEKEKKYTDKFDCDISDRITLQVLGVLLADKLEARTLAIKALNKLGIDI